MGSWAHWSSLGSNLSGSFHSPQDWLHRIAVIRLGAIANTLPSHWSFNVLQSCTEGKASSIKGLNLCWEVFNVIWVQLQEVGLTLLWRTQHCFYIWASVHTLAAKRNDIQKLTFVPLHRSLPSCREVLVNTLSRLRHTPFHPETFINWPWCRSQGLGSCSGQNGNLTSLHESRQVLCPSTRWIWWLGATWVTRELLLKFAGCTGFHPILA